jgi:hypothetical protein
MNEDDNEGMGTVAWCVCTLLMVLVLFLMSGCNATGEYFAGQSNEVASCFKADGSTTVFGQSNANAGGCKCTVSPEAGLRVTEAAVSADGECYMKAVIAE